MRLKGVFSILTIFSLILVSTTVVLAQEQKKKGKQPQVSTAPVLQEQLVYSWNVFDGKTYTAGFIPKSEDTIYLIANKDNAISAKKTLVYFWPITGKYMAGWKTLSEGVDGILEILKDGKVIKRLKKEDNVLYYPEGYWGEKALFYKDEEARKQYEKYKKVLDDYYNALKKYYEARIEYRKKLDKFFKEVKKRREAGEEGPLNIEIPKEPKPPKGPNFYVTEPKKDYIINLPPGKYRIRIRARDKTIIEGSEKNLFVFTSRRTRGVGYEIIPGNRWTKKEQCNDPASIIYAAGKNVLYFRPYFQDEYNELYHNKLMDPQNTGRVENWKWVHTDPIKDVILLFYGRGNPLSKVIEKPYIVQQIPGPELGYNILEYNKKDFPYKNPTFSGYQLVLTKKLPREGYFIYLEKKGKSTIMPKSKREIRIVKKENANFLYCLSIFPLVVGGIVFATRWRKLR